MKVRAIAINISSEMKDLQATGSGRSNCFPDAVVSTICLVLAPLGRRHRAAIVIHVVDISLFRLRHLIRGRFIGR